MSMQWTSEQLAKSDNPYDRAMAETLQAFLLARGTDIAFPDEEHPNGHPVPMVASPLVVGALSMRHLAFRQEDDRLLTAPLETLSAEESNRLALRRATGALMQPYIDLFHNMVPASDNERTTVKKRVKEGLLRHAKEAFSEQTDDLNLLYETVVACKQGETINNLTRAETVIRCQHDPRYQWGHEPAPAITVRFHQEADKVNQPQGVVLEWQQETPEALLTLTKGSELGLLLDRSFVFGNNDQDYSFLLFDLDNFCLRICQEFGGYAGAQIRNTTLDSTFIFMPDKNKLVRHFVDTALHEKIGRSMTKSLEPGEFIRLLQDVMALLPVKDVLGEAAR